MSEGKGRRTTLAVLVALVAILLYFFIFAEPLSPELSAVPVWKTPIAVGPGDGAAGPGLLAFASGDRYGYFSPEGEITFMAESPGGAPVSDASYVEPNPGPGQGARRLMRPSGTVLAQIDSSAPFYSAGRLFSAEHDGTGVSAYDGEGRRLWTYALPAHVSAFASGGGLVVGGTVDGWLEGVTDDGVKAFSFAPGGSRLQVVLGLGVSRSGAWIAAVCGIDRQRLVVLGRGGADYRVASHTYLETDYREPVRVVVMDDDYHVLYRRPDGIGVWSVDGKVDVVLPVKADDFDAALDAEKGIAYVIARRGKKAEIVAFRLPATILGRVSLPDSSDYARFHGSSAFIGGDDWLARFDFVED